MKLPNPGSEEAYDQGCICPMMANEFGAGCSELDAARTDGRLFAVSEFCPIHGWKEE